MTSYINKIFTALCAVLLLGATSCVGDLDLKPNDPNEITQLDENGMSQFMMKCYSSLAVAGQGGPDGGADISGMDGGTSQYIRAVFMMNEFTTDESKWIWPDAGVADLVTDTWGRDNANIFGTYSRFYVHIAVCNEFLRAANSFGASETFKPTLEAYKLEARALRALSYYNVIDLFGNGGFIDETSPAGTAPVQKTRAELYTWLTGELESIVSSMSDTTPTYGRIGKDAAEALLCRLYLNGKVFANDANGYKNCSTHAANIIARHQGGGFNGSGLAKQYLYLFCGNNEEYMPGGGNTGENEILWGVPYDSDNIKTYGGTMFLTAAAYSNLTMAANNAQMDPKDYGMNAQWGCIHATPEFADKFAEGDVRWSMWCKEDQGFKKENTNFAGKFTEGYGVVKFTNLLKGKNGEWSKENGGIYDPSGATAARAENFPDTDYPMIRLADVYLMYAESYVVGGQGNAADALKYVNFVRGRAGIENWTQAELTPNNILDERCRELYWENVRRTDLIRFGKFTGSNYNWSWKNNLPKGGSVAAYRALFPIPSNVIAAQPEFKQNPGY